MEGRTRQFSRESLLLDLALAGLITVSITVAASQIPPDAGDQAMDVLGYGLVMVAGLALSLRRRLPLVAVGATGVALSLYVARRYTGGPVFVTAWFALYSLACVRDRRQAWAAAALVAAALVTASYVVGTGNGAIHLVFVGWSAAAVFLGDARRSRRDRVAALEERALQLEHSRADEARRQVAEERLRIARDLHDSVAHAMATINVQAGAAAHVIEQRPDRARQALTVIQQASGEVLDELGAMLGLLRLDPDEEPQRSPTPGLAQLDDLVASIHRAGLAVTLVRVDVPADVPPPVGVAVHRIVQESLTNVVRHAGEGATAAVRVQGGAGAWLAVEIVDNGTASNSAASNGAASSGASTDRGSGVGIIGMRERAEASGGRLEAGRRDGKGFVVRATWPGQG